MNNHRQLSRIQRFTVFGILLAYALTALGVISIFTMFPEKTNAASGIHVRIIGPSEIIAEASNITASKASEAYLQTIQQFNIPNVTEQSDHSFFIKEIAGRKNWLYQVNGWTPPCTAMNDYTLSSNDTLEIYHVNHQYTTQTRIHSDQTSATQHEYWNITAETREPNKETRCNQPEMNSWRPSKGITLTVQFPDQSRRDFTIDNAATILLSQAGTYNAYIWADNMFPSNTISINVSRAQTNETTKNESKKSDQVSKTPQNNIPQQHNTTPQNNAPKDSTKQTEQQPKNQQPFAQYPTTPKSLAQLPAEQKQTTQNTQQTPGQKARTIEGARVLDREIYTNQQFEQAQAPQQLPNQESQQPQTDALNKAAQYLLSQKNDQGLIGDPSLNSWALIGLVLLKGKEDTQVKEVVQAHEAYIDTIEDITALEVEKNILLCIMLQKDPKKFGGANIEERFLRYIDDEQIGDKEAINDDFWGILTLRALNVRQNDPMIQKSKEYILKNQNDDGGFGYATTAQSDTDDTAAAILALLSAGMNPQDEQLQKAFSYIESANDQQTHGYKHQAHFEHPSTVSTAWILQAYRAAGKQEPQNSRQFLLSQQQDDGSFNANPGQQQTPILTTALTMPILAHSLFPLHEVPQFEQTAQEESATQETPSTQENQEESQTQNTISSAADSLKPQATSTDENPESGDLLTAAKYYKQKSATLEHNMNSLEETIKKWRRANTMLIITIIVIIVGIVIYTVLFHTNIFRKSFASE